MQIDVLGGTLSHMIVEPGFYVDITTFDKVNQSTQAYVIRNESKA